VLVTKELGDRGCLRVVLVISIAVLDGGSGGVRSCILKWAEIKGEV
jgi:hypothetical protein